MAEETNPWKRQMMNKQSTPTSAPPSVPTSSTSSPQAPWKKVDPPSINQSPVQNNPWKSGGGVGVANNPWMKGKADKQKQEQERKIKEEEERVKREQEERLKREQEEERERVRLEEERRVKEKEDEERENRLMTIELELSSEFERQQKSRLEEERIKQVENNKSKEIPKEQTKKESTKASKQPRVKAAPKNIEPEQRVTHEDESLAFKYYSQFGSLCSDHASYSQKLQSQKRLLAIYHQFQLSPIPKITEIINAHDIPPTMFLQQSNTTLRFIKSTSSREYSFCGEAILYDESKVNQAKKLICYSNLINNSLIDGLRRRGDIGLRIGLVSLVEYRGVLCLIQSESALEADAVSVDADKLPQAAKKLTLLLKEINNTSETGLSLQHFTVKTLGSEPETFVLSLKESALQSLRGQEYQPKQKELIRDLSWINNLQKILDSPFLQKYSDRLSGCDVIKTLVLSKKILQIYRSGQAEIDDIDFLGVVVRMDASFVNILKDSGVKDISRPKCQGLFLQLIQRVTGLELLYDEEVFETENVSVKAAHPLHKGYTFDSLECVDVSKRYLALFQEGKTELSQQSFQLKEEVAQTRHSQQQKVGLALQKCEFLYLQEKYQESLQEALKIKEQVPPCSTHEVQRLTMLIKNYSALSNQNELLSTFNQIVSKIQFILGQETHFNSYLYCLLAIYYLKREDKVNQMIGLYQLALNIDKRIFGQNSPECGEIHLAIAQAYINHRRYKEAKQSIQSANVAYQQSGNKPGKVECIIMIAQLAFTQGDSKLGEENLNKALHFYQKAGKVSEIQKVLLLSYRYSKQNAQKERIHQQLFELGNSYGKDRVIQKALELTLKKQLSLLSKSNVEKLSGVESADEEEAEDERLNFVSNLNKWLKASSSISQLIRQQIGAFIKAPRRQGLIGQLKSYLGHQKFDQIINSPSPS